MEVTYWGFRMMIGFGGLAALAALVALWVTRKGTVPASRGLMRLAVFGILAPFGANAAGWIFTEMGRQPFVVAPNPDPSGIDQVFMFTAAAVSPGVSAGELLTSLVVLTAVYARAARWSRSSCWSSTSAAGWPPPCRSSRTSRWTRTRIPTPGRWPRTSPATTSWPSPTKPSLAQETQRILSMELLPTIWFIAIAVLWTGYLFLEGFDLGVGMLMKRLRPEQHRTPRPAQHDRPGLGRQRGLAAHRRRCHLRGLPALVRLLFSALYLPLLLVLVALIFRAVAFEYRGKVDNPRWRARWDWAISLGSFVAAFGVGAALALTTTGLPIERQR